MADRQNSKKLVDLSEETAEEQVQAFKEAVGEVKKQSNFIGEDFIEKYKVEGKSPYVVFNTIFTGEKFKDLTVDEANKAVKALLEYMLWQFKKKDKRFWKVIVDIFLHGKEEVKLSITDGQNLLLLRQISATRYE